MVLTGPCGPLLRGMSHCRESPSVPALLHRDRALGEALRLLVYVARCSAPCGCTNSPRFCYAAVILDTAPTLRPRTRKRCRRPLRRTRTWRCRRRSGRRQRSTSSESLRMLGGQIARGASRGDRLSCLFVLQRLHASVANSFQAGGRWPSSLGQISRSISFATLKIGARFPDPLGRPFGIPGGFQ